MQSTKRPGYRLYKMSTATGALLSLPLILVVAWYAWSSYAQIDRYARATSEPAPWSMELFQIALHDELVRDLRRITLEEPPANGVVPTFALSLTRDSFDALNRQLYESGKRDYVNGYVQKDDVIHEIRLRYRGSKPWHWIGPQKSMKLRLQRGDLVDGTRIFNLINDPTAFGMDDQIILDLARELDLLTPEYHPVRVRLNNNDLGLYRYSAQPVEGLLRRGRRMPGHIYSGDSEGIDPELGVGDLFFSRQGWQQVAAREGETARDGGADDFEPLDQLLAAVRSASYSDFADYAQRTIDLDRYATFDALDVVFAGNEHDYFTNHKLYYDPYRGRLEPVAWSFRGFQYEPELNLIDHPLLIRLKMTPGYLTRRNRTVFSLLMEKASVPTIRAHADQLFAELAADLSTDPYWDAYKLLPRVSRFHRFMVRPMSTAKWALAARAELFGYSRRVRFLLDHLESPNTAVGAHAISPTEARVDVTVDGHSSHQLQEITIGASCEGTLSWRADRNRNGRIDDGDPLIASGSVGTSVRVAAHGDLEPGVVLAPRADAKPKRGSVSVQPEPRTYSYLVTAPCVPSAVALILVNQVTGGSTRLTTTVTLETPPADSIRLPASEEVPSFAAGDRSPHLWDYPAAPATESIQLGPGTVAIDFTRSYETHQHVTIQPGTRVEMAPGASLLFRGRVDAIGTLAQPIAIVAADPDRPFGGILIRGPATRGSSLVHVHIEGGSTVTGEGLDFPSLISLFDTADILIESAGLSGPSTGDNVLHATYVKNLRLNEVDVENAPNDAVDLEFTEGEIRGLHVAGSGDDCLDLMGVQLRVSDSVLQQCRNNAISTGEQSELTAHSLYISDSKTALLAKNNSRARITRSLIFRTRTALATKRRDIHYTGNSSIGASELYVAGTDRLIDEAAGSRIDAEQVQQALPTSGALHHLSRDVLGISHWGEFEMHYARSQNGGHER